MRFGPKPQRIGALTRGFCPMDAPPAGPPAETVGVRPEAVEGESGSVEPGGPARCRETVVTGPADEQGEDRDQQEQEELQPP